MKTKLAFISCSFIAVFTFSTEQINATESVSAASYFYKEEVKLQALKLKLHEKKKWLRLGHYGKSLTGGYVSKADGMYFFLSPEGKTNPESELYATLEAFFYNESAAPADWKFPEYHAQCRFPARFAWLKEQLNLQAQKMPVVKCERYSRWIADLNPDSVTLVFASFFMNNPASMFGHTLLRINRKRSELKTDLLDFGVNYAANPTTENALLYAFFGITGGFPGTFSMLPYYFKVNEYSDMESRDLWEYDLSLNRDEVIFLSQHLWELGFTHFDYYYFDENCSYQLLSAIEAARPELDLTSRFVYVVQPADTVKAIARYPGLITQTKFRPSLMAKYIDKYQKLGNLRSEFKGMVKNRTLPNESLPGEQRALLIDTTLDWLSFKKEYDKSAWPKEDRKFYADLLLNRSKINVADSQDEFSTPEHSNPLRAQETSQIIPSAGVSSLGYFAALNIRPALKDLTDSPEGITPLSQILILTAGLRIYPEAQRNIIIDNLTMVDIVSLSPLQNYLYSPSYRVYLGINNRALEYQKTENFDKASLVAEPGIGLTLFSGSHTHHFIPFTFVNTRFETSPIFQYNYRWGFVSQTGIIYRQSFQSSLKAEFIYRYFILPAERFMPLATLAYNYTFSQSLAIEASGSYYFQEKNHETLLSLKWYL